MTLNAIAEVLSLRNFQPCLPVPALILGGSYRPALARWGFLRGDFVRRVEFPAGGAPLRQDLGDDQRQGSKRVLE